jgi:hypothetical protein
VFGTDELHLSFYPVPGVNEFKATVVHELTHLNHLAQRVRNDSRSGRLSFEDLFDLAVTEEVYAQALEHNARVFLLTNGFPSQTEIEQRILSSFRIQLQNLEARVLSRTEFARANQDKAQLMERAKWSDSERLNFILSKIAER